MGQRSVQGVGGKGEGGSGIAFAAETLTISPTYSPDAGEGTSPVEHSPVVKN